MMTEIQYLLTEANERLSDLGFQIEEFQNFQPRFHHIWPTRLDLESQARQAARLRRELQVAEGNPEEIRRLFNIVEGMIAENERHFSNLLRREDQDRYRY